MNASLIGLIGVMLAVADSQVFLLQSMQMSYSASGASEAILWLCEAESSSRSYRVRLLDRAASPFDLEIFQGASFDQDGYLETVQITVENRGQQLTGIGRTADGSTIRVTAFGGSVEFRVENSALGRAIGRCQRVTDLN